MNTLIASHRIHALYYDKSRLVIGIVAFILVAETGTNIYLIVGASGKSSDQALMI